MGQVVHVLACLCCSYLLTGLVLTSTDTGVSEVGVRPYTPEYLLSLGKTLNSPLLKLIGLTLCNVKSCGEWSQWSQCSEKRFRMFGSRNRTRMCRRQNSPCELGTSSLEETDHSLCEAFCPSDFNLTSHGYCLKLTTGKGAFDTARKRCQQDGAHVVNINSNDKLDDIKSLYKLDDHVWVDGTRPTLTSEWTYSYGPVPFNMNWNSGQPNNLTKEFCMVVSKDTKRFDSTCTPTSRYIICEKTKE